jgi:vacuolar-type H+-ATPase subunit F/Vma7
LYRVLAIGDEDFCAGFALAGIETQCARGPAAREALAEARASGQYGVVIVDEQFGMELEGGESLAKAAATIPVVVAVPAEMHWGDVEKLGEDSYVATMIRQAIGYQLDINL